MGASNTKEAKKYFEEVFTSPNHPTENDFTEHLTLYSKSICSGIELEGIARPIVVKLAAYGEHNRRLNWIICHCRNMFTPVVASSSAANETHLAALRVVGLIMRHIHALVRGRSAALLELIGDDAADTNSNSEPKIRSTNDARKLCELLLEYIIRVKVDVNTVSTHAEVASLLLSMCSSSLHHTTRFDTTRVDVFVEMILSYKQLKTLVGVLLTHIVEWGKCPEQMKPLLYSIDRKTNFAKLFSWFTSSRAGASNSRAEQAGDTTNTMVQASCSYWELTFRHLAQLLVLLAIHQRGNKANPVVEYIKRLKDGQVVRFSDLLGAIATRLIGCPSLCALLYVLLYDHHSFLTDVLASDYTQVMRIIQSLQHLSRVACMNADSSEVPDTLPTDVVGSRKDTFGADITKSTLDSNTLGRIMHIMAQFSYPFICFMTGTLLLILSQDSTVNQHIFSMPSQQSLPLRHYAPRELSVGTTYLIGMCVDIAKALKDCDEQLAMLFASCMSNMASYVHDIDSHTSQQLLLLIISILKNLQLVEKEYQQAIKVPCEGPSVKGLKHEEIQQNPSLHGGAQSGKEASSPMSRSTEGIRRDGQLYLSLLDIVVESFEIMLLQDFSRNNECLTYELLYHRDEIIIPSPLDDQDVNLKENTNELSEISEHFIPHVRKSLSGLLKCILSYEAEIASVPSMSSRSEIISIIRRYNKEQISSQLPQEPFTRVVRGGSPISASSIDIGKFGTISAKNSTSMENNSESTSVARVQSHEVVYIYEESPRSYDFFAPFLWATMLNDARLPGGILWCTNIEELPLFFCQSK